MGVPRQQFLACVLGAAVAVPGVAAAATAPDSSGTDASAAAAASEPGRWKAHTFDFWFMGFTATYSCDGLADKLKLLLQQAGASKDVKVVPLCTRDYGRPDSFAEAKLTFASLQPVSAGSSSGAGAAEPVVAGVWRHVVLMPQRPLLLQGGDCELVEQFRQRLLPLFATRNLQDQVSCVPYQDSGNQFRLSFEVFVAAAAGEHTNADTNAEQKTGRTP